MRTKTVGLASKGQLVLPKTIRDRLNGDAGTEFSIIGRGTEVVIKPTRIFPATALEPVDAPSVDQGKPLSLEDVDRAVQAEAVKRR